MYDTILWCVQYVVFLMNLSGIQELDELLYHPKVLKLYKEKHYNPARTTVRSRGVPKPPSSLLMTVLRRQVLCNSYSILFEVCVLCRIFCLFCC